MVNILYSKHMLYTWGNLTKHFSFNKLVKIYVSNFLKNSYRFQTVAFVNNYIQKLLYKSYTKENIIFYLSEVLKWNNIEPRRKSPCIIAFTCCIRRGVTRFDSRAGFKLLNKIHFNDAYYYLKRYLILM